MTALGQFRSSLGTVLPQQLNFEVEWKLILCMLLFAYYVCFYSHNNGVSEILRGDFILPYFVSCVISPRAWGSELTVGVAYQTHL
jgi:Ca2+/H+ antiporter